MRLLAGAALVWAVGRAARGSRLAWRGRRRREASDLESEVVLLAELTMLGVAAGLSFVASLAHAAGAVDVELRGEVARVLARARIDGQAAAFAGAGGRAGDLYRLVGRALASGAPLAASLSGYVAASRDAARARRLAAAQRLPIRLLVPLTLLILPGFVVLTAGPALLTGLDRLGG